MATPVLTSEMVEIIDGYSAAVVATVTPAGLPAASVKGTFVVEDDQHIAYGDIRSPGTRANLQANPAVEVVFTDVLSRGAVRITGSAEIHDDIGLSRSELTDSTFQRMDALAHIGRDTGPVGTNEFGQPIGPPLEPKPGTDLSSAAPMSGRYC